MNGSAREAQVALTFTRDSKFSQACEKRRAKHQTRSCVGQIKKVESRLTGGVEFDRTTG